MGTDTTIKQWEELRKPFPEEVVGTLPKGGVQLQYVGHAAVTDRLLSVDPEWTWEPLATTENGLPAYDNAGGLWIKLTVNGVTRLGYGDGADPKVRIGDALRNAAMRFGVALDLWTKEELESHVGNPELKNDKPSARQKGPQPSRQPASFTLDEIPLDVPDKTSASKKATQPQISLMLARARDKSGLTERKDIIKWFEETTGTLPTEVLMSEVDDVLRVIMGDAV